MSRIHKRSDLLKVINRRGYKTGLEIGVKSGCFSEILLDQTDLDVLYSVDVWLVHGREKCDRHMTDNRRGHREIENTVLRLERFGKRSVIIRASSHNVAHLFTDESLDFIELLNGLVVAEYVMAIPKMAARHENTIGTQSECSQHKCRRHSA